MKMMDHPNIIKLFESFEDHRRSVGMDALSPHRHGTWSNDRLSVSGRVKLEQEHLFGDGTVLWRRALRSYHRAWNLGIGVLLAFCAL